MDMLNLQLIVCPMRIAFAVLVIALSGISAVAQTAVPAASTPTGGIMLSPARVELEMAPGTERTVVINLDRAATSGAKPTRILATLQDWTMTRDAEVVFHAAGTQPKSASPWLVYSPTEAVVEPGSVHSIRVTVTVPPDASAGDHLAAVVIEPRPEDLKLLDNTRQMRMRFHMAAVFYVKVSGLTKAASLQGLTAEVGPEGIVIRPLFRNDGNSMVRPMASVRIMDASGQLVAELPQTDVLPVLGGSEISQRLILENTLKPGTYSVHLRADFQGGGKVTEGIAELVVAGQ
jgi:hypothetical protein